MLKLEGRLWFEKGVTRTQTQGQTGTDVIFAGSTIRTAGITSGRTDFYVTRKTKISFRAASAHLSYVLALIILAFSYETWVCLGDFYCVPALIFISYDIFLSLFLLFSLLGI